MMASLLNDSELSPHTESDRAKNMEETFLFLQRNLSL